MKKETTRGIWRRLWHDLRAWWSEILLSWAFALSPEPESLALAKAITKYIEDITQPDSVLDGWRRRMVSQDGGKL